MAPHRPTDPSSRVRLAPPLVPCPIDSLLSPMPTAMECEGGDPSSTGGVRGREDDELTSLSWLQDRNLLKSIRVGADDVLSDSSPAGSSADDYLDESSDGGADGLLLMHPTTVHVPYNPKLHVTAKPPYSFSCLIFMAIEDAAAKALPVKDIYAWILVHFPYFHNAPTGWKNSVRHNLSLNKCFRKVDKDKGQNIGKGSLWCIDPDYRPNLLQALRKTPYHPYHQLQMLATQPTPQLSQKPLPLAPRLNVNIPSPELFPYLSKRLAASSIKDPEVDAAATMLALKNGPHILADCPPNYYPRNGNNFRETEKRNKRFRNRFRNGATPGYLRKRDNSGPVITTNPSEDHTYSTCNNNAPRSASPSSIDEAFEFSEQSNTDVSDELDDDDDDDVDDVNDVSSFEEDFDSDDDEEEEDWENVQNRGNRLMSSSRSEDDEEQKKIVEGADALLNLAGIKTNLCPLKRVNHHRNTRSADVAQR